MTMLATAAFAVAFLIALELLLRGMGFGSFPLFESSASGVYRMRRHLTGRFRRRHAWSYDANGMRNDRTPSSFENITLLIGDSIVDGGLGLDQSQTLAAVSTRHCGESFYTVACHGWALGNCLPAVRSLPGWSTAKRLVFVLNSGDFDSVVRPDNELNYPTRHPAWLTLWLVRRQGYRWPGRFLYERSRRNGMTKRPAARSEEMRALNLSDFRELLAEYAGPVFLVRYPMRGEDARSEFFFERLAALDPRVRILEAAEAEAAGWSDDCYADYMHPNVRGLEVLARHLCQGLG